MAKRKAAQLDKTEERKRLSLEDASFIDKSGKKKMLFDVIDKEVDCWFLKNKGLWILTHAATEKIALKAGISSNYLVDESPNVQPTYQNELEHIVRVTIKCNAKKGSGCVHNEDENTFTVTGESNRVNTPHRGRGYLRKMAEKRGFDIAVLKHLGLYTTVFSEDEVDEFKNPSDRKDVGLLPGSKEFEAIVEEINLILNAATKQELKAAGSFIKKRVAEGKYSEKQHKYLKDLFKKEVAEKVESF